MFTHSSGTAVAARAAPEPLLRARNCDFPFHDEKEESAPKCSSFYHQPGLETFLPLPNALGFYSLNTNPIFFSLTIIVAKHSLETRYAYPEYL